MRDLGDIVVLKELFSLWKKNLKLRKVIYWEGFLVG